MKKLLLVLFCACLLGLAIAPKLVGTRVNTDLKRVIEQLDANPAYQVKVTELGQSWFSTHANIEVKLDWAALQITEDNAEQEQPEIFAQLQFNASHGPILFTRGLSLGWLQWSVSATGEELRKHFDFAENSDFYRLTSKTDLLGHTALTDHVVPFAASDAKNAIEVTFGGYDGRGTYTQEQLNYKGLSEPLQINSAEGQAIFSGLSVDLTLHADLMTVMQGHLYDSRFAITLKSAIINDSEQQDILSLTDLLFSGETQTKQQGKLVDLRISYALGELVAPELVGKDLTLAIEINNISEDFTAAYQEFASTLNYQDPQALASQLEGFFQQNLLLLLKPEPEINITDVHGSINNKSFNGALHAKIVAIEQLPADFSDPAFWIAHLLADARLLVDKQLAMTIVKQITQSQLQNNPSAAQLTVEQMAQISEEQGPLMLQGLTQQGLLLETPDGYKFEFNLTDGAATLNGNAISLPVQ
jgi:uncharacterized protein YdgA (DUF945 family)